MKFVQIVSGCDMTRAAGGGYVSADETVYIALGRDPNQLKVRELDLTGAWMEKLRDFMQPFLDAGHEPGEMGDPGLDLPASARANDPGVRAYNGVMREWAKATGYRFHKLEKGGYYYPVKTKQAYAHHAAGQDYLLTEENHLQPDYDPVTGNSV